MKKSLVPAFFKVSINHLFDNLESGKEIILLEKVWKKSCILDSKICRSLERVLVAVISVLPR